MSRPQSGTYPVYFDKYISLVNADDLISAFIDQRELIGGFFESIPESKAAYAYAPGKWTLKQLLQHIIDTERIFAYRALSFSRNEEQSLPGFDENAYAISSEADSRTWNNLCGEVKQLRTSTELLFESFTSLQLEKSGKANGNPCTVIAAGFIIVGHVYHHQQIVIDRYL
jgi:hypothetical protein